MVEASEVRLQPRFQWLRRLISASGKAVAWLTLVMVLLTFFIVVLRYGFNLGWIWLQESVTYMHVTVFMVAAAWTLQQDEHVRVDIFYNRLSERKRHWVNLIGVIVFLVPLCVFIIISALPYVGNSWKLLEKSREAGGLPLLFLLKSLILIMPTLLLGQAFLMAWDAITALRSKQSFEQ